MYKDLSSHEYKNFCTPRTSGIVDTTREQILRYILYLFSEDRIILNTYLTKKLTQRFNLSRYQVYRIIRQLEKHGAIRKNVISKKLYEIELVDPRVLVDLTLRGQVFDPLSLSCQICFEDYSILLRCFTNPLYLTDIRKSRRAG